MVLGVIVAISEACSHARKRRVETLPDTRLTDDGQVSSEGFGVTLCN